MISVKEYTAQRDEWIYAQSNTLSYKTIANHLDITESRVKQILARMRKEKKNASSNTCKKCGGKMEKGFAINQTFTGMPDDIGGDIVTMSPGGSGKLIECCKCVDCGWSVT